MKPICSLFLLLLLALPCFGVVIADSGGNSMLFGRSKGRTAATPHNEATQAHDFTPVEGPNLRSRFESATRAGVANSRKGFWIAYSFDLRPRTGVEVKVTSPDGSSIFFPWLLNIKDPTNGYDTKNAGVFLRFDATGKSVLETNVFNIDLQHSFQGLPVYWLGKAASDESLALLNGLIASGADQQARVSMVDAIGLHGDSGAMALLKDLLRTSPHKEVRGGAARWLSLEQQAAAPGRAERKKEDKGVRQAAPRGVPNAENSRVETDEKKKEEYFNRAAQAVLSKDNPDTPYALRRIYRNAKDAALKERIISHVYERRTDRQWLDLLVDMAGDEYDPGFKKLVLSNIVKVMRERGASFNASAARADDKNLSLQDVHAAGALPIDAAIQRLIEIAKTQKNELIRNAAFEELSNIPDNRVVVFFNEVLSK